MAETKYACRPQDDLYTAVNGEWLKTAVIPDDRSSIGGFNTLDVNVEKLLMDDFEAFRTGAKPTPEVMDLAVKIYSKALDTETREKTGFSPIVDDLKYLEGIHTLEDLSSKAYEISVEHGFSLPFAIGIDVDAKDSDHHVLTVSSQSTILPDTTYYQDREHSGADALLKVWADMARELLTEVGIYSESEVERLIEGALKFDETLSTMVKSSVEWADYIASYNPSTVAELSAQMPGFDLAGYLDRRYPGHGEKVIVADPRFFKEFTKLLTPESIEEYTCWARVFKVLGAAPYASERSRVTAGSFRRTLHGIKKAPELNKYAYQTANSVQSQAIGIYYGRTYFGEEAKKDIVAIVKDIIQAYKERIATKDWLSPATREKAQLKLSTLVLKLGYPEDVPEEYKLFKVEDDSSLMEAMLGITKTARAYSDSLLLKDVDRSLWGMPGHMVNACYNPTSNDLTFPAAILQAPFYSIEQSRAENLGGIGCVIGHEISHAFDNNGAQCDEKGNINNWWTEEDYKNFQARTQAEIEQMDHLPTAGEYTNGQLIVSESIADNGGMAAALQAAHSEGVTDLKPFFENWGKIWCQKAEESTERYLLKIDVHAPHYWRANIQPRNFQEWYDAFDVKPGDGMYLAPEKRVSIW